MEDKKDIRDYLHLYLGCEVLIDNIGEDVVCRIINVSQGGGYATGKLANGRIFNSFGSMDKAKLLLRPLSDMKEEEVSDLENYMWEGFVYAMVVSKEEVLKSFLSPFPDAYRPAFPVYVRAINWFRKNGFDVDELIESGIALDKTKQP